MSTTLVIVAIGGALGAVCRWAVFRWAAAAWPSAWAVGTITVNLLGAFAFGVVWSCLESRPNFAMKSLLLAGFMGSFTTFSTFVFECVQLMQAGRPGFAFANLALQNVAGLAVVYAGLSVGKALG